MLTRLLGTAIAYSALIASNARANFDLDSDLGITEEELRADLRAP